MDARIDINALRRTSQAIAFHWGTLVVEVLGVAAAFAVLSLLQPGTLEQPEGVLPVLYVVWTLRALQLLAQLLVIVFLTRLIGVRNDFADARLIYIALIIIAAVAFILDGVVSGISTETVFETMYTNMAVAALFAALVVLDLVAKPVLLAMGNRSILFACGSVLDSFGLYELAKGNRRLGARFAVASVVFAFVCLAAVVVLVFTAQGSTNVLEFITGGIAAASSGWATVGWSVLLLFAACAAIAYLTLWILSARGVGRTYGALQELSS